MSNLRREKRLRMNRGETEQEAHDNVSRSLLDRQGGRMPASVTMVNSRTPRRRSGQWGRRASDNQAYPKTEGKDVLPTLDFPDVTPSGIMDDDGGGGVMESYKIQLIYEDDSIEMIPIAAIDADDALNQALAIRDSSRKHLKVKTSIVQDGVGEVLTELAHGIEKGYTIGSKAVGKVGRGTARVARGTARVAGQISHASAVGMAGITAGAGRTVGAYRRIGREYKVGRLETIFADMDSDNPSRRALARRELKTRYPEIYSHIGWKRV